MTEGKQAIDVGHEIADVLEKWRPNEGSAEDIATAVIHGLIRYNINVAPTLESELRTIFNYLERMIEEEQRSF